MTFMTLHFIEHNKSTIHSATVLFFDQTIHLTWGHKSRFCTSHQCITGACREKNELKTETIKPMVKNKNKKTAVPPLAT